MRNVLLRKIVKICVMSSYYKFCMLDKECNNAQRTFFITCVLSIKVAIGKLPFTEKFIAVNLKLL